MLTFALKYVINPRTQIDLRVVSTVRTAHQHGSARLFCRSNHANRRISHVRQAHLGQVVEIIFIENDDVWGIDLQRTEPLAVRDRQHRVVNAHVMAEFTRDGGRIQRSERRERLHRFP